MLKSGNLFNFGIKKIGLNFLTSGIRETFYCLRRIFIKAIILWDFNLKYHIEMETNILYFAIRDVLSQLTSAISQNRVVTKINLGQ